LINQADPTESRINNSGVSLAELLIAITLIGIGIMASAEAFKGISKSVQNSKSKSLASNIAQEKMQVIMQKSYYEVLVTTAPAFKTIGSTTFAYDPLYFAPEIMFEGGIRFTRYTDVQVVQENSGAIQILSPNTPDTGMRQITVTVVWQSELGEKYLSIQSVLNNPNTVMSNVILNGIVRNAATGSAIPNAVVNAAENIGWRDTADAAGNYQIHLVLGSFNFQASAPGYYSQILPLSIGAGGLSQNFNLTPISTGTITGTAWLNPHVVISQVVASTGPSNSIEYIELYNPTTAPINVGTNPNNANAKLWIVTGDAAGNALPDPQLVYISTYIPINGFYLITNTGDGGGSGTSCDPITIQGTVVSPDACWRFIGGSAGSYNHALQCHPFGGNNGCSSPGPNAGGVALFNNNGNAWTGVGGLTVIDGMAWNGNGTIPNAYLTSPLTPVSGLGGMGVGEDFMRRVDTSTAWTTSYGNSYNTTNTFTDFNDTYSALLNVSPPFAPRTTATIRTPKTGMPAYGTIASVTDGNSVPSSATARGIAGNYSTPPYAQFFVSGVSTGAWIVFLDSGVYTAEIDTVSVVALSTTSAPNATTNPVGTMATALSNVGITGMISGKVTDVLGTPLSGITVTAGGYSTTSSANGSYFLRVAIGTYDVTANPGNANGLYAIGLNTGLTVSAGDVTQNITFALPQGGKINGWITRDGVNALPGVTVVALDANGSARDTEVSATNGQFLLINLTTGTYTVQPVLDSKETASPASASVSVSVGVTTWSSTFTVTGAMGTVVGNVTAAGQPIKSGVLIVVSTTTIGIPLVALSTNTAVTYYSNSSNESGQYALDVRGSTSTTYNVSAFYMTMNNQTPVISSKTVSNVTVTAGQTGSPVNFSW